MAELLIPIDNKSKAPLYEQIYQFILREIREGRLKSGSRLPSSRGLSRLLCVSRSTVDLSYGQLAAEGYIEAIPCKGYYVCDIAELHKESDMNTAGYDPCKLSVSDQNDQHDHMRADSVGAGMWEKSYTESDKSRGMQYDFTPNGLDLNSFPQNTWQRLSRECMRDGHTELFRLGDPQGEYPLREALARYLYRSRNVLVEPEQLIIGAGSEYLLMVLSILLGSGTPIAMEEPSYGQAFSLFKNMGHPVRTVLLDKKGIMIEQLDKTDAKAVYVMPSHQYPTGIVMPIGRRMELIRWAQKGGRYIIEDDYDSEFRYRGRPVPSLFGIDERERVVFLGTFSKSIAPAIRVAYMALPKSLLRIYQSISPKINSTVSRLDQLILDRFIRGGYFERNLNRMRTLYKGRHDKLLGMLKTMFPGCCVSGEHAGVHVLLHVPGHREKELVDKAKKVGISIYGISDFYLTDHARRQCMDDREEAVLMIGYANLSEEEIERGIRKLAEVF